MAGNDQRSRGCIRQEGVCQTVFSKTHLLCCGCTPKRVEAWQISVARPNIMNKLEYAIWENHGINVAEALVLELEVNNSMDLKPTLVTIASDNNVVGRSLGFNSSCGVGIIISELTQRIILEGMK